MATLQQEWEEEVRLHQMSVRKQRSEMMKDIERLEAEYDARLLTMKEKTAKVRNSCDCIDYLNLNDYVAYRRGGPICEWWYWV